MPYHKQICIKGMVKEGWVGRVENKQSDIRSDGLSVSHRKINHLRNPQVSNILK